MISVSDSHYSDRLISKQDQVNRVCFLHIGIAGLILIIIAMRKVTSEIFTRVLEDKYQIVGFSKEAIVSSKKTAGMNISKDRIAFLIVCLPISS